MQCSLAGGDVNSTGSITVGKIDGTSEVLSRLDIPFLYSTHPIYALHTMSLIVFTVRTPCLIRLSIQICRKDRLEGKEWKETPRCFPSEFSQFCYQML